MDFRRIGDQLALRAFDEQKAEGDVFKAAHTSNLPTGAECVAFATLMAKIMGTAIVENVPGYGGTVTASPNTGDGVDLPIPSVIVQVDELGVFVDLWWKSGATPTEWTSVYVGRGGVVSVDASDEATPDYLSIKLANGAHLTWSVVVEGGVRKMRGDVSWPTVPGFYEDTPEPVGVGAPGDVQQVAHGNHSHAAQDAVVEGAFLLTALIEDPRKRLACRGLLPHGEGVGFGSSWQRSVSGLYEWQHTVAARLTIASAGGTIEANDGDRLLAWSETGFGPNEPEAYWIYEVIDCGFHWVPTPGHPETPMGLSTYPVIRRAADANTPAAVCQNATVQITGEGVEFEGEYFTITNENPIVVDETELAITHSSSFTPVVSYKLLTPAQMVSAGVSTDTTSSDTPVTVAAEPDGAPMSPTHETISGTPGLAEIPAGRFAVRVKYRRDADAADITRMEYRLHTQTEGSAADEPAFLSLWSPPLHATSDTLLEWEADLAAAVSTAPEKQIVGKMFLHTNSATPVTVYWTWNDAGRSTRLRTPWQNPVAGGTNSHPDLLNRHLAGAHPFAAIERAIMATAIVNGPRVTAPATTDRARVVAGGTINGLRKTGFVDGQPMALYVSNPTPASPVAFVDGADQSGYPEFAPLSFETVAGVPSPPKMKAPTWIKFWFDASAQVFRQDSKPIAYVLPS